MLRDRCIYEASLIWYMLVTNLIWNRCCVCLGEFELKEELVQIPYCKHVFHLECIHHWLQSNSTCPLCRCSIIPTTKFLNPAPPINIISTDPPQQHGAIISDFPLQILSLPPQSQDHQEVVGASSNAANLSREWYTLIS